MTVKNKTKIDDVLMEMISPKIKEIEQKFSSGKGLNHEDIVTLLLKSQFNHINHLDQKLDEVSAEVASLKVDFANLKADFANQKTDIQRIINRNMQWSMGIIAFIVTALKLLDLLLAK